jgi:hypothetical protein
VRNRHELCGGASSRHGRWVTADGRIRVDLKPDGRFDELRTDTRRTHHGTYRIDGDTIHFHDPLTGYEAIGEFRDGVMHADRCEFRRE